MNKTVNQRLADEAVKRRLYVHRFANKLAQDARARILKARLALAMNVQQALEIGPPSPAAFNQTHLVKMIRSMTDQVMDLYEAVTSDAQKSLAAYTAVEVAAQNSMFTSLIPEAIQQFFPITKLTTSQVVSAALERPFQGALLKNWAEKQAQSAMGAIASQIQTGYTLGESHDQIVKRVTGTRDDPGLLNRLANDAGNVVKTAVGHYQATATELMGEANKDILKAQEWLSTLDSHTSTLCQVRDKKLYTLDKNPKPIKHAIPWGAGPGKLHFCCRSTRTFVTKSWQELGIDSGEMDAGTRASMNGQVAADMSFTQWVARQEPHVVYDLYGPQRGQLILDGKLKPDDMFNDKGEFLTLDQLAQKGMIKAS